MSGEPPAESGARLVVPSSQLGARPLRPQFLVHKARERRRALIVGCVMLLATAMAAGAMIAVELPTSVHPANPSHTAVAIPESDLRSAKVTRDLDGKGCSQQVFDNQTGRMSQLRLPCEATTYDSNGVPVPLGTIHRLDAISKSFSGH
jgi:hypothetical protein